MEKQKGAIPGNSLLKLTKWIEKAPNCHCGKDQIAFICMHEDCEVNKRKIKNKEFRIGQENDLFCL